MFIKKKHAISQSNFWPSNLAQLIKANSKAKASNYEFPYCIARSLLWQVNGEILMNGCHCSIDWRELKNALSVLAGTGRLRKGWIITFHITLRHRIQSVWLHAVLLLQSKLLSILTTFTKKKENKFQMYDFWLILHDWSAINSLLNGAQHYKSCNYVASISQQMLWMVLTHNRLIPACFLSILIKIIYFTIMVSIER